MKSSDAVFVFLILQGTLVSAVRGAVGTRTAHRVEYFLIRKGDFDGTDKVIVRIGAQKKVDDRLGNRSRLHLGECFSDRPDSIEFFLRHKQILTTGTGLVDVDRREDTLLGKLSVEVDFHVAGAFEFLEDNFVHSGTGLDERGRYDR